MQRSADDAMVEDEPILAREMSMTVVLLARAGLHNAIETLQAFFLCLRCRRARRGFMSRFESAMIHCGDTLPALLQGIA
jgi:hypothetical protein